VAKVPGRFHNRDHAGSRPHAKRSGSGTPGPDQRRPPNRPHPAALGTWPGLGHEAPPAVRPRQDSNLRTRFRKPMLYPLSYGGQSWAQCPPTTRRPYPCTSKNRR
jgi:hypothetical protein